MKLASRLKQTSISVNFVCVFSLISLVDANLSFGVGSSVLIAVPFASSLGEEIELAIQQALADAK